MNTSAIVLLSGGQDSTTCLFWALQQFDIVEALAFDYGQRHRIEIDSAKKIAGIAKVNLSILPVNTFNVLGKDALTSDVPVSNQIGENKLPNTFVPGRNLIFLTFSAAWAYQKDVKNLVIGATQTDYSGYPDCRKHTINALQQTLFLGMEYPIKIHTPLMFKSKKETIKLAIELGILPLMKHTHTCYKGERPPCKKCQACKIRANGFYQAGLIDPLEC